MEFDLYRFLKLKDKSQQLFVENNPHIYIYGDIIINIEYQHSLKLKSPDKKSFFMQLFGIKPGNGAMFTILDSAGNCVYHESYLPHYPDKDYDYSVKEYNDDGWLIKTHRRDTYIDWVYDIPNNLLVGTTYYKDDGTIKSCVTHKLNEVEHIFKKKLVHNN